MVFFADVDQNTGLLTPKSVEKVLKTNSKIGVIAVVHLGGQLCDIKGIQRVAKKYSCLVIEDACHAPGLNNSSFTVGDCKYSDAATFSFHAIKHITMGEGGCITTNNKEIADLANTLRNHGIIREKVRLTQSPEKNALWYYEMHELGWNYRADEMSCALGISQLSRHEVNLKKRKKLALSYFEHLSGTKNLSFTSLKKNVDRHAWHLFSILINFENIKISRGEFMKKLAYYGIGSQVHYIPLFKQPYYKKTRFIKFEGAVRYYNRTLSLPLYVQLKLKDIKYICSKLKKVMISK